MAMQFGVAHANDTTGSVESFPGEAVSLVAAVRTMARLRAPDGCPWDREQSFDSLKKHTLEETYEVFDAIERRDWADLRDELGDLLLQVLFYAQVAADDGLFTIADVAATLTAKLERRHPHIFPDASGKLVDAADAAAVNRNWERVKAEEKRQRLAAQGDTVQAGPPSLLSDVSRAMPAMMEATKLGSRASRVGFDWPDASGLFAKMDEELAELMVEVESGDADKVEAEFGDLMFTAANLARHLGVDAEAALRRTNAKFRARFGVMEALAGGDLGARPLDELEALWNAAKARERTAPAPTRPFSP